MAKRKKTRKKKTKKSKKTVKRKTRKKVKPVSGVKFSLKGISIDTLEDIAEDIVSVISEDSKNIALDLLKNKNQLMSKTKKTLGFNFQKIASDIADELDVQTKDILGKREQVISYICKHSKFVKNLEEELREAADIG